MRSYFPVLSLLLSLRSHVSALSFDVHVRSRSDTLTRRADTNNTIPVANTHNSEYIANVTLGGRDIPVLLDTGSSDLWVTGTVPNSKDTGKSVSLSYAVGQASGDIYTADMSFAGYNVADQAFLLVNDTSAFSLDIEAQGFSGLIGLGPATGSVIRDKLDEHTGDSVLGRIFSQNTTTANYLTILLNRLEDPDSPSTGQLTVSETLPQYSNITSMPKLTVDKVHKLTDEDQHWQVYTDVNGIIGPDGSPISYESIVPSAPDGQLVVVFDSGFTLPQVPRTVADAIYGRVQGAEYNTVSEVWTIPCDQYLTLTFKFGGVEYPIHPLDISSSDFNMVNSLGDTVCLGAFQPITSAFSLLGEYDMILGMAFMRNVYALLDYGNFIDHSDVDQGDPFIQLLSLTDVASAKQDFVQVRLNGVDTTGSSSKALLPTSQEQHSPISAEEKKKLYEEKVLSHWPEILVGCLAFVLISAGLIIWRCCVHRRKQKAARSAAILLPGDTKSMGGRPSYAGSQVALNRLDYGDKDMRQSFQREYRPSFASSRHQV
ncbi:aspartic peptidase A1 [Epithele typhae]|uniref:aspartic peptidase A1 n=1 Tax=Epithele typhae TaxID=378194 RepID=UPI0020077FC0|nr:aspartic peptidase A1 [Epithele typhae]KAH9933196.1 aspartic peptidase A1 [Epithele typhae]